MDHIPPIVEYSHREGQAVVGGYVYRGTELPDLEGLYLFGDFSAGKIWTLKENFRDDWELELLLETNFLISSFGEDEQGELYVVGFEWSVFKIVDPLTPDPTPEVTAEPTPEVTPDPTPEVVLNQTANIECDQRLRTGVNGRKKLIMNAGSRVSCVLSVDNPGFEMPITLSFGIRSKPDNNIVIRPGNFALDENGEFEFTINAIKGGDNWLEWSLADEIDGLMFNIDPRDRVRLATMFVGVEYE